MNRVMNRWVLSMGVVIMLLSVGVSSLAAEQEQDPFRPGAAPMSVTLLSWAETSSYPNRCWGEVIEIDGWLSVEASKEGIKCFLFQSQEAMKFRRPKMFLECQLDDKTLNSYKSGDAKEWLKLNGRYVSVWAVFRPTAHLASDDRISWLKAPFVFQFPEGPRGQRLMIVDKNAKWPTDSEKD